MSFKKPVVATISQRFGADFMQNGKWYYKQVLGYQGHNGDDYAIANGSPVYAADDGTVTFEGWGQNHSWMGAAAGICVLIDNGGVNSGYAHMISTVVNKGQRVTKGQLIGYSGSTGAATGPHLHFEALPKAPNFQNGYAGRIDPNQFMETSNQGGGTLMTPNFIRRTYWLVVGREPSQGEIDFHMSKSNPESFVNGFGETPLWKEVVGQRDVLTAERNELVAARNALQEQFNAEIQKNTPLQQNIADLAKTIETLNRKIAELEKHAPASPGNDFGDVSLGELLSEAFKKLFKIK